jgi:hypothetical protein
VPGSGWWRNGLVWRTGGLALGLSLLPAASVAMVDQFDSITCQAATSDLPRNAVIEPGDLDDLRVRRSNAPRDPVGQGGAVGRTLATDLKKGDCASLRALRAPLSTAVLPWLELRCSGRRRQEPPSICSSRPATPTIPATVPASTTSSWSASTLTGWWWGRRRTNSRRFSSTWPARAWSSGRTESVGG